MGKSGIICRKIAATLSSTGTSAVLSASGRGDSRRSRRHPRRRRRHRAVAQRRDRGARPADRVDPADRREADRDHRLAGSTLGRAADVTLDCCYRRRSVPDEPGADRQHDGVAGAGRRARHDAARAQRIPRGAVRGLSSGRQAGTQAHDRRQRDERGRRRAARLPRRRRCPTSFTRCRASVWG